METFVTSDQHFGHRNIIRHCSRPFSSVFEMNQYMIAYWNNTVTNNDIVYHLGDFGLAPQNVLQKIFRQLNGKKIILVKGNHDKSDKWMLEIGFDEVHKYIDLKLEKKKIFMGHVPMYTIYHDIMICGHIHKAAKINGNIVNVGVDVWDYRPVSLDTLIKLKLDRSKTKYMITEIEGENNER